MQFVPDIHDATGMPHMKLQPLSTLVYIDQYTRPIICHNSNMDGANFYCQVLLYIVNTVKIFPIQYSNFSSKLI